MRPAGLRGRLFGTVMERMNAPCYRRAIEVLAPDAGERFLEIGFGTGRLVELLLQAAPGVEVAGVDPTGTMLQVASSRSAVESAGARVDLRLGHDHPLPWPDGAFHGAAALHSFQFWPDPEATCRELRRVLRPAGRLVIVLRDHSRRAPSWLPNPISRSADEPGAARRLLEACGFEPVTEPAAAGGSRVLHARAPGLPGATPAS